MRSAVDIKTHPNAVQVAARPRCSNACDWKSGIFWPFCFCKGRSFVGFGRCYRI